MKEIRIILLNKKKKKIRVLFLHKMKKELRVMLLVENQSNKGIKGKRKEITYVYNLLSQV